MTRAHELAGRGWGRVAPNPLVGAVVVREGEVVGEGYHAEFGGEHAEVAALKMAGAAAHGATLYVSLEPCRHSGKTPPCVDAIRAAGIRRVVAALRDPNPEARGGAEALRVMGIEVKTGVEVEKAIRLNSQFLWRWKGEGPWVTLKLAMSLDGRIAAGEGQRTQLTGEEAEAYVHRLRAGHEAVLVGGRTALIDDPLLTVRGSIEPRRPPLRVVLDPELRVPASARAYGTQDVTPTLVLCRERAPASKRSELEAAGVSVTQVAGREGGGLSLREVFAVLEERGVTSVLVEGGGRLAQSLMREDLVRSQALIVVPRVLGPKGVPAFPPGRGADFEGRWVAGRRRELGQDTLIELEHLDTMRKLREAA